MSDDIPIIYAQQVMSPKPVALFLSASNSKQMEQFIIAGWRVMAADNFSGCSIPAELDCEPFDPEQFSITPTLMSASISGLEDRWYKLVQLYAPSMVKINAAFSEDAEPIVEVAERLAEQDYTLCAAHWRNANTLGLRVLDRIDSLSVFKPTPWTRLNIIGFANSDQAQYMLRFGRFYASQEKRIGDLLISQAIRGDYITQLEEALKLKQSGGSITLD